MEYNFPVYIFYSIFLRKQNPKCPTQWIKTDSHDYTYNFRIQKAKDSIIFQRKKKQIQQRVNLKRMVLYISTEALKAEKTVQQCLQNSEEKLFLT